MCTVLKHGDHFEFLTEMLKSEGPSGPGPTFERTVASFVESKVQFLFTACVENGKRFYNGPPSG